MTGALKKIRLLCVERANGLCECGCGQPVTWDDGQLDHYWGRAKAPESVANCWYLTPECHYRKTTNWPSPLWWLGCFARHCRKYELQAELTKAHSKMAWLETKNQFKKVRA